MLDRQRGQGSPFIAVAFVGNGPGEDAPVLKIYVTPEQLQSPPRFANQWFRGTQAGFATSLQGLDHQWF